MMRGHIRHISVIDNTVEVWYESMTGDSSDSIIDRHEWHTRHRAMEVAKHLAKPYDIEVYEMPGFRGDTRIALDIV